MNSEQLYNELAARLINTTQGVTAGKMMSSPAVKHNNMVFIFYHNHQMGFRLGPAFDAGKFGLLSAKLLAPFKTKPPLKGWYMVHETECNLWEMLAEMALQFTKTL